MKNTIYHKAVQELTEKLQAVPYETLSISSYNKSYIKGMIPAIGYFLKIYATCLQQGIAGSGKSPRELTMIDFGGGSGFLSMLAKSIGIGHVIYVDLNPLSVQAAFRLKEYTGTGADLFLEGSTEQLADWCRDTQSKPDLLIATDLIEHVYDLKRFFAGLVSINPALTMYFTTASTPYNPYVKRKLRKIMDSCETGDALSPNYFTKRYEYIRTQFPSLNEDDLNEWAHCTRGLTFGDINNVIQSDLKPVPSDPWNTCDPENGNWTERILPIQKYRDYLKPYAYDVIVSKGFYNEQRDSLVKWAVCKCLNSLIGLTDKMGLLAAPFIIISCLPRGSSCKSDNPHST